MMDGYKGLLDTRKGKELPYEELFFRYKEDELKGQRRQQYDEATRALNNAGRKLGIAAALFSLAWLPLLIVGSGLLSAWAEDDISFATIYQNAPFLFWLLPFFFGLGILASVWFFRTQANVKGFTQQVSATDMSDAIRYALEQFGVPEECVLIDCFQNTYGAKAAKPAKQKEFVTVTAHRKGDYVYLVLMPYLLKIPRSEFISGEMVEKTLYFNCTKPQFDLKDPEIKQYGITPYNQQNQSNLYRTKFYGGLMFQSRGEIWTLCVMPNQLELAQKLFRD